MLAKGGVDPGVAAGALEGDSFAGGSNVAASIACRDRPAAIGRSGAATATGAGCGRAAWSGDGAPEAASPTNSESGMTRMNIIIQNCERRVAIDQPDCLWAVPRVKAIARRNPPNFAPLVRQRLRGSVVEG